VFWIWLDPGGVGEGKSRCFDWEYGGGQSSGEYGKSSLTSVASLSSDKGSPDGFSCWSASSSSVLDWSAIASFCSSVASCTGSSRSVGVLFCILSPPSSNRPLKKRDLGGNLLMLRIPLGLLALLLLLEYSYFYFYV
jgi:hypothetical protein